MDAACRLKLPRAQQAVFVYYCKFNLWVYYSNVGIALYLDWDYALMRRYLFGSNGCYNEVCGLVGYKQGLYPMAAAELRASCQFV